MQLTKYRAFGKFRVIQMAVSLLSMLIYWGFSSGIFEILFNYNESSIDYNAQKAEQVRHDMLESSMYLSEYMNIQGYTTTIMFILMLAVLILFYQEKNGLFSLCPGRKPKEGNSFNDFSVFVDKCVVVLHYLYHLSEYRVLHYGKPHGIYTEKYI